MLQKPTQVFFEYEFLEPGEVAEAILVDKEGSIITFLLPDRTEFPTQMKFKHTSIKIANALTGLQGYIVINANKHKGINARVYVTLPEQWQQKDGAYATYNSVKQIVIDGKQIKIYHHDEKESATLETNKVQALIVETCPLGLWELEKEIYKNKKEK